MDKDIEFDASVPEYCPDIARLIKVDCTPFTESCEIEEGKAIVKGKAVYDVLYETDYKSRLRCCSFTQEFSHSLPIPRNNATDISAFCEVSCERIGCKLLSPRRLILKTTVGAQFDLEGEISVKAVSVNEDKETFFRKKTVGCEGRTLSHEDVFRFSESVPLTQNEKCIGEIVCGNIVLQQPQVTLLPGRAEIKTSASAHVLYEEESNEGHYCSTVKTLPINITYQNEAIEEFKHASLTLAPINAEFNQELDQYGESRVIKLDFGIKMQLKLNEPKAFTLADDLFEKGFDGTPSEKSAFFPQFITQNESAFSVESEQSSVSPSVLSILDSTARCHSASAEKSENGISVKGLFSATLLYESEDGIFSTDCVIPYEHSVSVSLPEEELSVSAEVFPTEIQATLRSDGSIALRVSANTRFTVLTQKEESFVSEITKRSARTQSEEDNTLVYCFPQKGEDVWDIAKFYRADPEKILEANPSFFDENRKAVNSSKPILIKA